MKVLRQKKESASHLDEHGCVAEVDTRRGDPLGGGHEKGVEEVRRPPHGPVLHHLDLRPDESIAPRERNQILGFLLFGVVRLGELLLLHLRLNQWLMMWEKALGGSDLLTL